MYMLEYVLYKQLAVVTCEKLFPNLGPSLKASSQKFLTLEPLL